MVTQKSLLDTATKKLTKAAQGTIKEIEAEPQGKEIADGFKASIANKDAKAFDELLKKAGVEIDPIHIKTLQEIFDGNVKRIGVSDIYKMSLAIKSSFNELVIKLKEKGITVPGEVKKDLKMIVWTIPKNWATFKFNLKPRWDALAGLFNWLLVDLPQSIVDINLIPAKVAKKFIEVGKIVTTFFVAEEKLAPEGSSAGIAPAAFTLLAGAGGAALGLPILFGGAMGWFTRKRFGKLIGGLMDFIISTMASLGILLGGLLAFVIGGATATGLVMAGYPLAGGLIPLAVMFCVAVPISLVTLMSGESIGRLSGAITTLPLYLLAKIFKIDIPGRDIS